MQGIAAAAAAAAAAGHSYEQQQQPVETVAPLGTDHLTTTCTAGSGQEAHVQRLSCEAGVRGAST